MYRDLTAVPQLPRLPNNMARGAAYRMVIEPSRRLVPRFDGFDTPPGDRYDPRHGLRRE